MLLGYAPPPPTAIVLVLLCSAVMVQLRLSDTAANHQQYYPGWGVEALSMIPQQQQQQQPPPLKSPGRPQQPQQQQPPPPSLSFSSSSVPSRRQLVLTTMWNTLGLWFVGSSSVPGRTHAATTDAVTAGAAAGTVTAAMPYQAGPRGVRYRILQSGTESSSSSKPQRGQQLELSYTLWLEGFPGEEEDENHKKAKQIDSSRKPLLGDQPLKIRAGVSQVIKGWDLIVLVRIFKKKKKKVERTA